MLVERRDRLDLDMVVSKAAIRAGSVVAVKFDAIGDSAEELSYVTVDL